MKYRKIIPALFLAGLIITAGCTPIDEGASEATAVFSTAAPQPVTGIVLSEPDPAMTVSEQTEAAAVTAAPVKQEALDAFHERLEECMDKYSIYGMGVALFRDGEVIYTDGLGYANVAAETPVTDKTIFRAASLSKMISTIPVMTLVDKGLYDFDGDLSEQTGIPYSVPQTGEVKLWHLLTHTAGLTDTYIYDSESISGRFSVEYVMKTAHIGTPAGSFYNYSNFGAGTMGAIIEHITGKFFHDYAKETMFDPLGIDAAYVIDQIGDKESCAYIYDYDGEIFPVPTWGRTQHYYESFGLGNSYLQAQCELLISAHDLALIGIALAGDGTVNGVRLLSEESIKKMHTKYVDTDNFGMGLNVRIYDDNFVKGRTICGHPGNALGAITGMFYDRADRTGVVFLTNRCYFSVKETGIYSAADAIVNAAYELVF